MTAANDGEGPVQRLTWDTGLHQARAKDASSAPTRVLRRMMDALRVGLELVNGGYLAAAQ